VRDGQLLLAVAVRWTCNVTVLLSAGAASGGVRKSNAARREPDASVRMNEQFSGGLDRL
jgi:hypothetical protein